MTIMGENLQIDFDTVCQKWYTGWPKKWHDFDIWVSYPIRCNI